MSSAAVTVLSPGDLAIIGFNSDGGDDFSFVTLVDVDAGTDVTFTDGEGSITYTAPGGGLPFGSAVVISNASLTSISASTGSVARTGGDYDASANGDELEIEQSTNYVYVCETRTTYTPPVGSGLSAEDATWVSHVNAIDNGRYEGPRIGTRRQFLRYIADLDNWSYTDGTGDQSLNLNIAPYNTPFSPVPAVFLTTLNLRAAESNGTVSLGVTLDRAPSTNTTVRFNTVYDTAVPGRDYVHTNGTITWLAGDRSTQSVVIAVLDNAAVDGPRAFNLFLYQPVLCKVEGSALASVTLLDDDVALPVVSNGYSATNVAARSAVLTGGVAPLDAFAEATIFWGPGDGGTNAAAWSNVVTLGMVEGNFSTRIGNLTPNATYHYRCAASNSARTVWAPATESFITLAAQAYYVNDNSLTDDMYCSAAGSDTLNNGQSPGTPKATVQAILAAYDLGPGDLVFIDTGTYNLASTITITSGDVGSSGNPVVLRGSTAAAGSVFNRNNISADVLTIDVSGDSYLRLENLAVTGGKRGFYAKGAALDYCTGLEIVNCEAYGNDDWSSEAGIYLQYCADALVSGCEAHDNDAAAGLALHDSEDLLIVSNNCYANGYFGIHVLNSVDGVVRGNIVSDHAAGYGISASGGEGGTYEGNVCHDNAFYGLDLYNCVGSQVSNNTSYSNVLHGIRIQWDGVGSPDTAQGPEVAGNRVFGNAGNGIENTARGTRHRVVNNRVYDNGGYNIRFGGTGVRVVFENNTLYSGKGVYFQKPGAGSNRHNILWATGAGNTGLWVQNMPDDPAAFVCDFNNMYATDSADVGRWPLPDGNPAASLGEWQSDSW